MNAVARSGRRRRIVRFAVIGAAALVLTGCGATASPTSSHSTVVTPTGYLSPSSMCSGTNGFLTQRFNGDLSGCFRVPAIRAHLLVVSIQTYLLNSGTLGDGPTTTTTGAVAGGGLTLHVASSHVTPGEHVTVIGRYDGRAPSPRNTNANLCWDGCRTGLVESGIGLHWTSATTFRATLLVPGTAWLESGRSGVTVHPLTSGSYRVGVQCLGAISGCALGGADASATVELAAPSPQHCATSSSCSNVHLSTSSAGVGDVVDVHGWAPLESVIGQPFGFELSVTGATAGVHYPAISYQRASKTGGFSAVLAPVILHVVAAKTWADLGHLGYVTSSFAGPAPIDVVGGSSAIAWCQPTALDVTEGASTSSIPTSGVVAALKGSGLTLFTSPTTHPPCSDVALVARYPESVFAGFATAQHGEAPPVYLDALYSTDRGVRWQSVPIPPGSNDEDFGGFNVNGDTVSALFVPANSDGGGNTPIGTVHGRVATELTTNGGATWTTSQLGCPRRGPCATFGPYQEGNCAMNGTSQALLVASNVASGALGVTWRNSTWPTTVNSCFSQQLVATSTTGLLLLDSSSPYPLLVSNDRGLDWSSYSLPTNDGVSFVNGASFGSVLVMTTNGTLFTTVTSSSGRRQSLLRLDPGATAWCRVPGILGLESTAGDVGAMRVDGPALVWTQVVSTNSGAETSTRHDVAVSKLRC